ncbi:hypothetical protein RJ639_011460 [Escallonia herrerae]|uniref:BHLH domain-containing protein n=1 Tax=Escallonia herrerae TaxID=1293975 RepID=A0AA88VLG3_9ASTE|nr:hypothetical protein RJ639_011460 [Escallonia herrerae]
MDSFDEELAAALGEDFQNSLSSESNCSSTLIHRSSSTTTLCASPTAIEAAAPPPQNQNVGIERPTKHHKPNSYNNNNNNNNNNTNTMRNLDQVPSSVPIILSFGSNSDNLAEQGGPTGAMNHEDEAISDALMSQAGSYVNLEDAAKGTKKANVRTRPPSQTYDHIIAERKRREQLSQRFVALSAIVPGLKKMDKTSVLGDAIKYLKLLQERVKILEEQATMQTIESVVLVKKSQLLVEDEGSSDENPLGSCNENSLPEIEARVCDKSVLLRIHCEKRKGVLVKILSEVEKLNLSVANTSVSPFGTLALDITIIAEVSF